MLSDVESRGKKTAGWILAGGVVLALLFAGLALRQGPALGGGLTGLPAPDFDLPVITAQAEATQERDGPQHHRGKVLLLHFWAPSCQPCVKELPTWQKLHDAAKRPDAPYAILTVAGDERGDVRRFLQAGAYTLRTVYDPTGLGHRSYRVFGIPHTVVIGADGVVRAEKGGALDEGEILGLVGLGRR